MAKIYDFLAQFMGTIMQSIYGLVNDYGVSIIVLTVLVRLVLLPMYARQIKYSAKINKIQPKVREIQTRYARDRETMNQKVSELYAQEGVNPSSGCLTLIIQLPIIMGLFTLLRSPLQFLSADMIMAVHEKFIWVSDLCQPDSWILPIIAGVTTYFTYAATNSTTNDQTGMMNGMKIFFPIMIFLMGKSFPAGLTLYWTVGNLFTIAQTVLLGRKFKYDEFRNEAREEVRRERKEKAAK